MAKSQQLLVGENGGGGGEREGNVPGRLQSYPHPKGIYKQTLAPPPSQIKVWAEGP